MKRPSLSFATFARSSFAILAIFACLAALAAPPPLAAQTQPAAHTDDPAPQQPPAAPKPDAPIAPMGNLNLQGVALSEVVNTLARYLKLNIIDDASLATVKNGVTLNTYGDPKDLDARNLLDQILRINGLAITEAGGLYHIVQLKDLSHQPLRPQIANAQNIVDDDQPMLNLIFLKYVTVDTLLTILNEFAGDNALIKAYPPANLLFVLDSRRNMRRLMELIGLFDNDSFANQRVRLFEVKNARPSDIVKELDNVLKSISLDSKSSTVKFLPIDRINTLIAVAPNAGVFDTVEEWLRKLDVAVKISAGAIDNYVYPVRYGRADCLAISLGQLFGTPVGNIGGGGGGYGNPGGYGAGGYGANGYAGNTGYGGTYGSPYGGGSFGGGAYGGGSTFGGGGYGNPGGYGNANNFSSGFGGAGACASYGSFGGGGSPIYGYGGYSAQTPAGNPIGATGQTLAAAGAPGSPVGVPGAAVPGQVFTGSDSPRPPRIVANPLDNKLLIQADAQQYQNIVRVLKDLDVPPRQILLEAKIYEVDLTDQFSSGINYTLGPRTSTQGQVGLTAAGVASLTLGGLVANGRELLATLTLNENVNKVHMVSEPSLIATDSIPASINVGTQVPVSTGSTTIPTGSGVAVSQNISSENTGVTLQVNARVNPSGIVTLIVNQEISGIAGGVSTGLSTPAFSQQIVQTQITVQDGDTIAIGGTISDSVTDMVNGIPVLIHIPWLGALFGSKSRVHSRTEMIIFMTPHVIYDETNLIEASDELKNRVKYLRKYLRGL